MTISNFKFLCRCVSFALITCICVGLINEVFKNKEFYNDNWPTTNTFGDFYRLEKNSVDVLFMGSSHAVSSYNPQVIYDTYGITSYNLGSEQQSIVMTYYWLREALKYQSPKVVVLDPYTVHLYVDSYAYNNMNCMETAVRKAMDDMRPSLNKLEAALVIQHYDSNQSWESFFLLNLRYHDRWKSLGENDYTQGEMIAHGGIKGFSPMTEILASPSGSDYTFRAEDINTEEPEDMYGSAPRYLDKIRLLCEKEGIQLVFSCVPCYEPIRRYRSIKEYADTYGIPLYDFNEENLYHAIDYSVERYGYYHPTYEGAEKISLYLGKVLAEEYHVGAREDASYDKSRANYEHWLKNKDLKSETNAVSYLQRLNDSDYSIFVLGPKNLGQNVDAQFKDNWMALGFETDLSSVAPGLHYWAVKSDEGLAENVETGNFSTSGSVRKGRTQYSYLVDDSVMVESSRTYSMKIDGRDYGNQNMGLDIVVYDNEYRRVIDSVNIDTTTDGMPLIHY